MVTAAGVHTLGNQLQSDPTKHANNVVKLLSCISSSQPEAGAKAAIQALKLHFVAACDAGDVGRHKRQKVAATADAGTAAAAAAAQEAAAVYRTWLQRQYGAFTTALLQLLQSHAPAASQVAAFRALMECSRHDAGPATFSPQLFSQALSAVLLSPHAAPEVFAELFGRYLQYADVRYNTLRLLTKLASSRAVRGSSSGGSTARTGPQSAAAAAADADEDGDDADEEPGAVAGGGGEQEVAAHDVARNMFDVLAAVSPTVATNDQGQLASWCGAAEAGLVVPAADAAASAKLRRKRKAAAAAGSSGVATAAAPGATPVSWANTKVQQRAYQAAWLSFLQVDLPGDIYRKVLLKLHSDVIPAMTDPALLSDFLTHALVSRGGLDGMLALHGIFTLVTRHGLEYPAFYARLYQLITPGALRSRHRSQFFKLADAFLASGLVPAYSAAAFAKRFARLALTAPAPGAMLCIAFVHNIIRRHPSCMVLLHKPQHKARSTAAAAAASRVDADGQPLLLGDDTTTAAAAAAGDVAAAAGMDVYDEGQLDPAASRAVESSLWELEALRRHCCPQVAAFVSILDKDLGDRMRTAEVDVQPLLGASTGALITQELTRRLKSAPLAFYATQPSSMWGVKWAGQGLAGREASGPGVQEDMPGWDLSWST